MKTKKQPSKKQPSQKPIEILVLEDIEDARCLVGIALRQKGYIVYEAENGAQAEKFLKEHPKIALAFLNITAQFGNQSEPYGLNFAEVIRRYDKIRKKKLVKILFNTGFGTYLDFKHPHNQLIQKFGGYCLLIPFSIELLVGSVANVLQDERLKKLKK